MQRCLLVAASLIGFGLQVIPQPGAQQAPVFRAGADYLPVDVVVTDENDIPITDLKVTEFEIFEGGRRQTIEGFRFVSIPVAERDLTAVQSTHVKDVASNVRLSPDSRLFVLLIDDLHTLESDIIAVTKVMSDFVRALSPTDEVAVVFAGRSDLSVNFTTDPARALKAIERTREAINRDRAHRDMTAPGKAVAVAFKNAARVLADSTHQRRAIVYVSGGSPIDHRNRTKQSENVMADLNDAFEAARRADVPIYSLDPRGTVQPADGVRHHNLSVASSSTGGRAFVNQSNLTAAISDIVRENGNFYVLGYYPSPPPRDGRFHAIDVKVTRPGARVRAKPGYTSSMAGVRETDVAESIAAAMSSNVDMRGLTLRAHVAPLLPLDTGMRSAVTIQVTYPTVPTDLPFDNVKVQIAALDADGKVRASSDRGYTFKPARTERESATFLINGSIDLPAQSLTLRIGVASRALGRTGTVHVPVTVPKPSDSELQMGGVVVGLTGPPRESAFSDDLVRGLVPFQPTTTRGFSQRSTLRVFAPFFWRGRDDVVTVTLTLRGPDFVIQREESLKAVQQDKGRQLTSLDTLIPMAKLLGPVTLRMHGRLANGQSTEQTIGFDVRVPVVR